MAIEDILQALDDQAQADCDAVIGEAQEHAKLIIDEAERQAITIHEGFARQVERVAKSEASKVVNAARLEAKMQVSSVKGSGVAGVFEAARAVLPSLRESGYGELFARLASEAFEGLEEPVRVRVAAADMDFATQAVATSGLVGDVVGDLDTTGGLVVELHGGRISRRNTLEDRLDRVSQFVQADVARVLFS